MKLNRTVSHHWNVKEDGKVVGTVRGTTKEVALSNAKRKFDGNVKVVKIKLR